MSEDKIESDDESTIEVVVEGEKKPPSVLSLRRSEVRLLPGAFGDPFRAIEMLPGVTPLVSGLPYFYVRGAPPGNVGYYFDGIRVPYLYHVAAGPSVINPALVANVELYSGGYPAQHGRFAGGIVSAEATEPRNEWNGEAALRLVDAGAYVEAPFADGRGSAAIGGRYSYTGAVLSAISPDVRLDYHDFQGRASFDLTGRDRISLLALGSYDYLAQETDGVESVILGEEFYRVDARYDARLPKGGRLRAAVTWGYDRSAVAGGYNTRDMLLRSRVEISQPLSNQLLLRGGVDLQQDRYAVEESPYRDPDDPTADSFSDQFPSRTDVVGGAWVDLVWQISRRLTMTPGLRVDAFVSEGEQALSVDPRLAVVASITKDVRLLHSLGMAHQPPSFVVPVSGLSPASLGGGLQRSLQASAGVEVSLPLSFIASATAFDSVFFNMTDAIGTSTVTGAGLDDVRSLGGAQGLEVYIRRSLGSRLGGFVSYTLSRSTRTVEGITFPAGSDRTHVLNTALSLDMGRGWRGGGRFTLYSGTPDLDDPEHPTRGPAFYRFDFRLEKRWKLFDSAWLSVVAEMLNATMNSETVGDTEVGPVTIPSVGLEGGF